MSEIVPTVFDRDKDSKLSVEELAEALYEGTPHLEFLMSKLVNQYGKPGAILPPFIGQNETCKDFFRGLAIQLVKYAIDGKYTKEAIE